MSQELGEIDYDEEAKLIATRNDQTKKPEIDLIINDSSEHIDKDEIEAMFIAHKIQQLVDSGQAKYKDIGILYRSINKKAPKILNIFSQEGIPVLFEGDSEQVDTIEINLFLKLLNLIDNHKQDIPLAAVLELPIFQVSSEDLAKIRVAYPDEPYFYQAVEKYKDNFDDEIAQTLRIIYQKLDQWRSWSKHLEIDEFLWQLLLDSGFYTYFGNLNNGKERKENLRLLIEKAKSYKDSSLKGITSFLLYVDQLRKNGQSLTVSGTSADTENVVHLMSIHKSKGLEFKIVFYGGLNNKFNLSGNDFNFSKKYGFGAKLPIIKNEVFTRKDNLLNKSLNILYRNELLSEEMRLLYVAMTRAEDQLYLVAYLKNKPDNKESKWIKPITPHELKNTFYPIDWIMKTIFQDQSFEILEGLGFKTNNWDINLVSSEEILNYDYNPVQVEVIEDDAYIKLKEQIFKQMDLPEKETVNRKPLKISVSRMKKHSIKEEEPIELIPIENNEIPITGKDIGTATHTLLQRIDLEKLVNSINKEEIIREELERLVNLGYISNSLSNKINQTHIIKFFNSEVGSRYLKSFKEDSDNVLKENPFLFDINTENELDIGFNRPIELSGIIDVCFLEDNKWVVIDYKTDHIYSKQQYKQRIDEYSTQINLYSNALEKLTNLPVKEKHIYFLNQNQDVLI